MTDSSEPAGHSKPANNKLKIALGCVGVIILMFACSAYQHAHPSAQQIADQKAEDARYAALLASQAKDFYHAFENASAPCDAAGALATAYTKQSDLVQSFDAVQQAEQTCTQSEFAMNSLKPPENAKGDVKTAFTDASQACAVAMMTKSNAYKSVAKVLNGDMSPAAQSEARKGSDEVDGDLARCAVAMNKAMQAAGVDISKMDGGKATANGD